MKARLILLLFPVLVLVMSCGRINRLSKGDYGWMPYNGDETLVFISKTIGIVLCQNKSESVVEYTLPENNEHIFASRYKTVLPSKEELKQLIKQSE